MVKTAVILSVILVLVLPGFIVCTSTIIVVIPSLMLSVCLSLIVISITDNYHQFSYLFEYCFRMH